MQKRFAIFLSAIVILSITLTCPIAATSTNAFYEYGYYNSTIFFQYTQLSDRYHQPLSDAMAAWTRTSGLTSPLIGRSFITNTVSTSYIMDCEFALYPDLWFNSINKDSATYKSISSLSYACTCHKSTAFAIFINNEMLPQDLPENQDLFYVKSRGVIAHELGHALGLEDHTPSPSSIASIMKFSPNFTLYWMPQQYDIDNANTSWAPHR